jgi:hypothetical protein
VVTGGTCVHKVVTLGSRAAPPVAARTCALVYFGSGRPESTHHIMGCVPGRRPALFKDAAICKGASAATITAPGDNQDRLGDIAAMGLAASVSGLLGMCTWTPVCGLGWALTTKGVYAR